MIVLLALPTTSPRSAPAEPYNKGLALKNSKAFLSQARWLFHQANQIKISQAFFELQKHITICIFYVYWIILAELPSLFHYWGIFAATYR